jgi:hypothetical protein
MFRSVLRGIKFVGIGIAALLSAEPLAAQTAVCPLSLGNDYQYCLYHGIGRQLGYEPSDTTSLTATANWDQPNDGDLHGLLPQTETYSDPLIALPQFPLQPTQPFYPNETGSHIYPNHYQSQVTSGGGATATHSGDDGGGVATYAGQPGCDPATLTDVSCESIGVTGDVASGVYSYTLHAFPATGTTFNPTNFDITVRATGNMVLTAESVGTATPNSTSEVLIDPISGVIRQAGTYQGANNTTSRLDVYALNVGHAGHVGGVTIPQIGSYLDTQGTQRWFPANPQDVDVSLPDQIVTQLQERDVLVDQYQDEARAELQRRYEAEQRRLARLREQYLAEQRRREQQQAQDEQPGLRLVFSPQHADIPSPVNPAYYDEWVASQENKYSDLVLDFGSLDQTANSTPIYYTSDNENVSFPGSTLPTSNCIGNCPEFEIDAREVIKGGLKSLFYLPSIIGNAAIMNAEIDASTDMVIASALTGNFEYGLNEQVQDINEAGEGFEDRSVIYTPKNSSQEIGSDFVDNVKLFAGGYGLLKSAPKYIVRKASYQFDNAAIGNKIPWTSCVQCIGEQGGAWEAVLKQSKYADATDLNDLVPNHKTFDFFDDASGTAISAKTLNTTTDSVRETPSLVYSRLKGYVDETADYYPSPLQQNSIRPATIENRVIDLAIPEGTDSTTIGHIERAIDYAHSRGVNIILTVTK